MTRRRILGICIVGALAASAVSAADAAAALPEFTGPFPNPFTSTSKATVLETVAKFKVKCAADTNKGQVTGPKTVAVVISFTGCSIPGARCQSPNGLPGEIVTEHLIGTLGYVKLEPAKEVGLDLMNPTGGLMAFIRCGAVSVELFGSVIGRISPLNKPVKPGQHVTLAFAQKAGHQKIPMFLGGPVDVPLAKVGGGPLVEAGLSSTDLLTFAAPIKILA